MEARNWSEHEQVPEAVIRELEAESRELEEDRQQLAERRERLDSLERRLRAAEERFRRRLQEHEQRVGAIGDALPPSPIQSGEYREAVRRAGDRVVSIEREIRVYRFDGERDLQRVVAHELGHALGLGHTEAPGALMNAEYGDEDRTGEGGLVDSADVELLRSRCSGNEGA